MQPTTWRQTGDSNMQNIIDAVVETIKGSVQYEDKYCPLTSHS